MRLIFNKIVTKINILKHLWETSKSFPMREIQPIIRFNRLTLKKVDGWISNEVYEKSIYKYGLPEHKKHLIDRDIGEEITYTDAILYLSCLLRKRIKYLELGVSVGKNFFQVINFFKKSNITGFDIEEINPVLESFLEKVNRTEWDTMSRSSKRGRSSLTKYDYAPNENQINYLSGDIFDEASWRQLNGNRFNVIFSDAFHSPDALLYEHNMIKKYNLLDEDEFCFIWDDLGGEMTNAFNRIWKELSHLYNLDKTAKLIANLRGWLGINEQKHEIGIIKKLVSGKGCVEWKRIGSTV